LCRERLVQTELPLKQLHFFRADVAAPPLTCKRTTRRKIDQREEHDAEQKEQTNGLYQASGDVGGHGLLSVPKV